MELTVKQAASRLGVTVQAVRKYCRTGLLKARMKTDSRGRRQWVITGGLSLQEPQEPPREPQEPQEPPREPQEPQEPPREPQEPQEPQESEEERWERIIREKRASHSEESSGAEDGGAPAGGAAGFDWSPEKIESWLRKYLPADLWERYGVLLWLWCQVAPEYLPRDPGKAGKVIFWGVPGVVILAELMRVSRKKAATAAAAGDSGL